MENNHDKYFKGQQHNEEYICFFRKHWIYLVKEIVYFAIFVIVSVLLLMNIGKIQEILRGNRELKILFVTGLIAITFFMHRIFVQIFNYFLKIGIITNMRVIEHDRTVYFLDNKDAIDMSQVQNIERIAEGILPNILGYGDIKIFLNASAMVKVLHGVPNTKFHFRCINRQKEARQRSLRRLRTYNKPNNLNQHMTQQYTQSQDQNYQQPIPHETIQSPPNTTSSSHITPFSPPSHSQKSSIPAEPES
jgi:hypothetical protein